VNAQVYSALATAAARIGNVYRTSYVSQIRRDRRGNVIHGYTLAPEHALVIETLGAYCRGRIDDNDAMAVLHGYEVFNARTGRSR
jgi:hypothetical protein